MNAASRPLAVVTGAASGLGYELAKCCAEHGYDLVIAADEPSIAKCGLSLETLGIDVTAVQTDLTTPKGVNRLYEAIGGRSVDALLASAGHGLVKGFLDQNFDEVQHALDTNLTGTIYLVHKIGRDMRACGRGRILFASTIAGLVPGSFQAVCNGTKAFIDSFAYALRNELKDSGVTVTCLMPRATGTNFFARADMPDTTLCQAGDMADPADVALAGFKAMLSGEASVMEGFKNTLEVATSHYAPDAILAERHRTIAGPGSADAGD